MFFLESIYSSISLWYYVLFGVDILVHILVPVKVIRRKVCDNGDIRALAHRDKLEARKLDNSEVILIHALNLRQERLADIAAEVDGLSLRLQQLGNNCRCRRFSVGTGHGDHLTRAQVKENLHRGSQHLAVFSELDKLGLIGLGPGAAENNIRVDIL